MALGTGQLFPVHIRFRGLLGIWDNDRKAVSATSGLRQLPANELGAFTGATRYKSAVAHTGANACFAGHPQLCSLELLRPACGLVYYEGMRKLHGCHRSTFDKMLLCFSEFTVDSTSLKAQRSTPECMYGELQVRLNFRTHKFSGLVMRRYVKSTPYFKNC